jgi:hypothetical protein
MPLSYNGRFTPSSIQTSSIYTNTIYIGPNISTVSFKLQLGQDSAAKPATNTWTIASDERIKKNIVAADLDICYSTMRAIPLRYFEWDPAVYGPSVTKDRHSIGFIAQEVSPFFPKAVDILPEYHNISSFYTLNVDQIYKAHIGATQQLMAVVETQQSTIAWLTDRTASQESTLSALLARLTS